ncbi:hypothetical protein K438DRAFT_1807817 [Mycena galopus ATCC 62051]|nr:hypothetical protein K438DRAFT_1807817 [Mycena galopus ATCC 62051]
MGRWTEHQEDSNRLPEGMKRIGYDDQTARYKFCDRDGNIYLGPPHEEYGSLTLVGSTSHPPTPPPNDRPGVFASAATEERRRSGLPLDSSTGSTFHELLPPHLVTSLSASSAETSPRSSRFGALPSMNNVVDTVRRSTTFVRKLRGGSQDPSKPHSKLSAPAPTKRKTFPEYDKPKFEEGVVSRV